MMMVLVLFQLFGKFFSTYRLLHSIYLCFCPLEYFIGLDAMKCILYKFAVLHHAGDIIGNPGLFGACAIHHVATHIPKQLLPGEFLDIFSLYLDTIFMLN